MTNKRRGQLLLAGDIDDKEGHGDEAAEAHASSISPDALDALKGVAEVHNMTVSQAVERLVENNTLASPKRAEPPDAPPRTARLSINISRDTHEALQEVSMERGITVTEAVRRLIGYGIVVYRANKAEDEVLVRRGSKVERVILLD